MGIGKSEHEPCTGTAATCGIGHEECREQLAERTRHYHDEYYPQSLEVAEHDADVHQHPHPNQEIWDEEGVAHELYSRHERACLGDETVDDQSCKEGTQQPLKPYQLGKRRTEEDEGKDEDVLHDAVGEPAKEPPAHAWEKEDDERPVADALEHEEEPAQPRVVGLEAAHHHCQHE